MIRSSLLSLLFLPLSSLLVLLVSAQNATLVVSSFDGPVTDEEIQSFNAVIQDFIPQDDNLGNKWAYGDSGYELRAMGVVYQITREQETLDQMIRFCDKSLSVRNDLAPAPVGQYVLWTGDIGPAWPNSVTTTPVSTGGEQGDVVGGLAYCAALMLDTPDLYNKNVTIGDPYNYGTTYLERAKTFLTQADYSMTDHVLSRLLDLSNQTHMYFAKDCPYMPGKSVPWNQAVMFTYAFQYLVDAHTILGDNATLTQRYTDIMNANLDWFFFGDGSVKLNDSLGNPIYYWDYQYGIDTVEDATHAKMDFQGYYIAYSDGRWCVGAEQMLPFADTFVDVMILPNGTYAGTVDGKCVTKGTNDTHGDCTTTLRQGYLYLSEFRPDYYETIMTGAGLAVGPTNVTVDIYSQFLWMKNLRAKGIAGNDPSFRIGN